MTVEGVSHRPVAGEVGGKAVIVTAGGRVFIDGKELVEGPASLQESLGFSDLIGDEKSGEQWDWTKKLTGEVMKMVLGSDRRVVADLATGKIQIEAVVDRAAELVKKILMIQIGYEEGRGRVARLDVDQAALRAIERVLSDSSHNWFNWRGVPSEMKEVVIKLLENYQQSQAVAAASGLSPEQMETGLANLKSIAQAKLDVEAGRRERMIEISATKATNERTDLEERNRIKKEAVKGVADVLRYHGAQLNAYFLNEKDGLLPMTANGLKAVLERLKEPTVWLGASGLGLGVVGGALVITAAGIAGGPLSVVVITAAGIAGGGFGAKTPEMISGLASKLQTRLTRRG